MFTYSCTQSPPLLFKLPRTLKTCCCNWKEQLASPLGGLTSLLAGGLQDGSDQVVFPLAPVPETIPTLDLPRQLTHAVLDLGLQLAAVLPEVTKA